MLKPVIAATAMLAIAGSSFVYAQQRSDGPGSSGGGQRAEHQHHRMNADDIAAFTDARIAALKAGLELTPDQAKNWPGFEAALRNMAQLRQQRMQARHARQDQSQTQPQSQPQTQTPSSPFDRLGQRADAMGKVSAALKQVADTGAPLYQSLTDAQKTRFTMLARILRPHQHRMARGDRDGGWRQGRGDEHGGRGQDRRGWGQDGRRFGQDGQRSGRREGRRFGQDGQNFGQEGRGFGQDGQGRRHHEFGENGRGPGGRMHQLMSNDGDQDSQL